MAVTETRENPYLEGIYAPIENELDGVKLKFKGELPADLNGVFARNGPNPRFTPPGRYHWFDGDGMIHAVEFKEGRKWNVTQTDKEGKVIGKWVNGVKQ